MNFYKKIKSVAKFNVAPRFKSRATSIISVFCESQSKLENITASFFITKLLIRQAISVSIIH